MVIMLTMVDRNKKLENCGIGHTMEVESYMKATEKNIAYVKIHKNFVKSANVAYAKVKDDFLTQEKIVELSLEFFRDNYPKVAGKKPA